MTDQDRSIEWIGDGPAVAAFYDKWIERYQIEDRAETEFFLEQAPGGTQFREC